MIKAKINFYGNSTKNNWDGEIEGVSMDRAEEFILNMLTFIECSGMNGVENAVGTISRIDKNGVYINTFNTYPKSETYYKKKLKLAGSCPSSLPSKPFGIHLSPQSR